MHEEMCVCSYAYHLKISIFFDQYYIFKLFWLTKFYYSFDILQTQIMNTQNDGYYFVIFPKFLQTKGFVIDKKLPQYSISVFVGQFRVDQISILPVKEQKLYHTIFWITTGRLEFKESKNQKNWDLVRIEIHDEGQLIGKLYLDVKEYIKQYEQENEHFYCQKVKISDTYEMEFELFIGASKAEIDNLLIQVHGESEIRTPITKQSQDRANNDSELNFDLMKAAQSELYSPLGNFEQKRSIFHKIDEESSINSSIPQSAPAAIVKNRFAFKINLNEVQSNQANKTKQKPLPLYDSGRMDVRKLYKLSLNEKLILSLFSGVSLLMIYLSMIPIKRI